MPERSTDCGVESKKPRLRNPFARGCRPFSRLWTRAAGLLATALFLCFAVDRALGQPSVWTYHYDNARTGRNTNETILTPANVNATNFGKLFTCPVDGYVFAQPLYIPAVNVPGQGIHNVLYVATEHDSVYAFDADQGGAPLWRTSFINPAAGVSSVLWTTANDSTVIPEEGITSTPVIDTNLFRMYVMAVTEENGVICYRLHALNIRNGHEITNTLVQAVYPGEPLPGSGATNIAFTAFSQNQRCALTLANGSVYAGYASHEDLGYYYGWVLGWDEFSLAPTGVYNDAPEGGQGGIWMSGNGAAADFEGNLYLLTGNAEVLTNNAILNLNDYGDSFLKLSTAGGLNVVDYFTPFNQASLNSQDLDLASGGVLLLPDEVGSTAHPHLMVGAGKEGKIYLVDRDNMGHYDANGDSQIVQELSGALSGEYGSPAYFNGTLYYHAVGDVLKAFSFSGGELVPTPQAESTNTFGYPGAIPVISANGAANGIVWEARVDGYAKRGPAVLYAWNATNVSLKLYDSGQSGRRDTGPRAIEFTSPVVANGKVYVAGSYVIAAYGLGSWVAPPVITPAGGMFTNSVAVTLASATPGAVIHYTMDGTEASVSSPVYSGPIVLTNFAGVQLKAAGFKTGMVASAAATAYFYNAASLRVATVSATFTGGPFNGNDALGLDPTEVAGVYPVSHWNNLPGDIGGPVPLTDLTGRLSPVVASWFSNEPGGTSSGSATPNGKLFAGYIDQAVVGTTTVTLTGVSACPYNLILYTLGDTPGTSGRYLVNGDTNNAFYVVVDGPAFDGTFTRSASHDPNNPAPGNYVEFDNIRPTNGIFSIQALTGLSIAPINGLQLIPASFAPLLSCFMEPGGTPVVVVEGTPGQTCTVQASTDLMKWSDLAIVTLTGNSVALLDTSATNAPKKFYRAILTGE